MDLFGSRIHFVGIGGAGTSALAEVAAFWGATVSGSDKKASDTIERLQKLGFDIRIGTYPQAAEKADLTVYSGAVPNTDEDLRAAKTTMERGAFLGEVSRLYEQTVAIAGTHGKSTVSAMISHVLKKMHSPFTSIIGGQWKDTLSGAITMGKSLLVCEACEYRGSFLSLTPTISVVTNTEYDHPDYYASYNEMIEGYASFVQKTKGGLIVGKNVDPRLSCACAHVRTHSFNDSFTITCQNVREGAFVLTFKNERYGFRLPHPAWYDFENAALAAAALYELGVDFYTTADALQDFEGLKRRMEYLGQYKGREVFSDYAHHPTQIRAAICACKQKNRPVTAIFQPHTYSRTKTFLNDFANALDEADEVLLLDVYGAREQFDEEGSSPTLFEKIHCKKKTFVKSFEEIARYLTLCDTNATLLFLGAGSIGDWATKLIEENTVHKENGKK